DQTNQNYMSPYLQRSAIRLISAGAVIYISIVSALAGGIKGKITDEQGEALAFATICVKQSGSGTTTNVQGYYELVLRPGGYDISFQYMGYETVTRHIDVTDDFAEVNIVLREQATLLQTVEIRAGKED